MFTTTPNNHSIAQNTRQARANYGFAASFGDGEAWTGTHLKERKPLCPGEDRQSLFGRGGGIGTRTRKSASSVGHASVLAALAVSPTRRLHAKALTQYRILVEGYSDEAPRRACCCCREAYRVSTCYLPVGQVCLKYRKQERVCTQKRMFVPGLLLLFFF